MHSGSTDGNIPGIIDGGSYVLPLNVFLIHTNGLPDLASNEIYILVGIYVPFLVAGVLGLIGALAGSRKLMSIAGFVGMCAVPISIFTVTRLMLMLGITSSGMEWTSLFSFNQSLSTGTYTMALWTGFYMCAIGSYLIFFGRPKRNK